MRNLSDNRTCTKCGENFPATVDYFYKQKDGKYGLRGDCKSCLLSQQKQYYQLHRDKRIQYIKQYQITKKGREVHNKAGKKYCQTLNGHLHLVYNGIEHRCNNPKSHAYLCYGGRGIENRFVNFRHFMQYVTIDLCITDIAQIKGLQIDRIDNDGNYEPGNIRWVTAKVNANNRKRKQS